MPDAPYQLYRAEQRRRRRWPYIVIAAVCVFAAVVGWQLYGVPRVSAVTPGPDAYVKNPSPTVVLDINGLSKLKDVAVTFDGKDVTAEAQRDGDTLTISARDLADGEHAVAFSASSSNLFRRDVRKDWRFTVDTSVPELKLEDSVDGGPHQHRPGHLQRRDRALRHGHRRRRRRSRRAARPTPPASTPSAPTCRTASRRSSSPPPTRPATRAPRG